MKELSDPEKGTIYEVSLLKLMSSKTFLKIHWGISFSLSNCLCNGNAQRSQNILSTVILELLFD